jgi:hypothetical protein
MRLGPTAIFVGWVFMVLAMFAVTFVLPFTGQDWLFWGLSGVILVFVLWDVRSAKTPLQRAGWTLMVPGFGLWVVGAVPWRDDSPDWLFLVSNTSVLLGLVLALCSGRRTSP